MANLRFSAFISTLCLLLATCVCDNTTINIINLCTIVEGTATCEKNQDFKLLNHEATNITKLIVTNKELKRINKDDLATFTNLAVIDLSNSGLEEIDPKAFTDLTKLHKLNLAGNTKLKIPNDGSFIYSESLTCLNLSNTNLEELNETFANVPHLRDLDLSSTTIKDFAPLKHLKNLTKLVVSKDVDTNELCTVLQLKNIIQKDKDGNENQFECPEKEEIPEHSTISSNVLDITTSESVTETTTIIVKNETEVKTTEIKEHLNTTEETISPETETTTVVVADVTTVIIPENTSENITEETKTENEVVPEVPAERMEPKSKSANDKKPEEPQVNKTENIKVEFAVKEANEHPVILKDLSQNSDDVILPSTANTSHSNGVNIVLGIILCVMVVGAIIFGVKYWKNRRSGYTHANTQDNDDEDKELQTIVAHRTDPDQN